MDSTEEEYLIVSDSGSQFSDDPDFVMEETRLSLSNLSLKRESKRPKIIDVDELDYEEEAEEELNEKDEKSYEIIQKMIEGGKVHKLKVDECKIYLRKHGLRLSGKKDILIQRITEHVDIINGGGEQKYPASSFVLNCKGDACKGDVVIFEQNVYEEFSIVSRSSNGGPCGTRIVAGRILKESYGAAKQQHTFTIEVLWSKGEKPLPPLHPLLIKGRNLYRMNTMRQRWEDEGERQRILSEKHARGGAARSNREARIQQKEMRKTQKPTRATRNERPKKNQENEKREPLIHHPLHQQQQHAAPCYSRTQVSNIPFQPEYFHGNPNYRQNMLAPPPLHLRPPLMATNCNLERVPHQQSRVHHMQNTNAVAFQPEYFHGNPNYRQNMLAPPPLHLRPPLMATNCNLERVPHQQSRVHHMQNTNAVGNRPIHQQQCRYFGQGRCHFGDRCKFSHELGSNK